MCLQAERRAERRANQLESHAWRNDSRFTAVESRRYSIAYALRRCPSR